MSEKRSSVKVNVLGQEITIRSEASAEHTREVASYVDKTIRQIMNSGAIIEPSRAAVLAALQITDELFRARASQRAVDESMQSLSSEIRRWLPPAKRA
jgi:cell division protein ZapA